MTYFRIPTTYEVYQQIVDDHCRNTKEGITELNVFSSCTDLQGEFGQPHIFTAWGFSGSDYPVIEAHTTWESYEQYLEDPFSGNRQYWLICVKDDVEDYGDPQ